MNKKLLLLFMLIILIPVKVNAMEGNTELSCNKEKVVPGGTVICTLSGNISGGNLVSYHGEIVLGENLTIQSIVPNPDTWSISSSNQVMDYIANENITGQYGIATITIIASSTITNGADTSISIANANYAGFTGPDDTEGPDNPINLSPELKNIRIVSTNNNLSNLTVSSGTLNPEFNKDTVRYNVTVEPNVSTATVSATAEGNNAVITGDGEKALNYGTNEVVVSVKSEAEVTKEYTILINRTDNRNSGSDLLELEFYNYNINFNKSTTNYTLKVDDNITTLALCNAKPTSSSVLCINSNNSLSVDEDANITAVTLNNNDIRSLITSEGNTLGTLKEGENILSITVTAENEDSKTYRVAITKGKSSSSDGSSASTTGKKGEIENPKTGSAFIMVILAILIVSISSILYFYKKNQKNV